MSRVVHAHGTGADRREGGIEQGHFNALPDAVALTREQRDDDTDDGLKSGIVGRDRDGGIHRPVGLRSMWSIRGCCGSDYAFESAHLRPRIV